MNEVERKPLFQVLFFNGYEYYFDYDTEYDIFKISGLSKEKLQHETGIQCLKILSKFDEIFQIIDKYKKIISNMKNDREENLFEELDNLEKELNTVNKLFSIACNKDIYNAIATRNVKIRENERELATVEKFIKENGSDEYDVWECKEIRKKLKELTKMNNREFIIFIFDRILREISSAKFLIDYYYNLVDDKNTRDVLNKKSPYIRVYALQSSYSCNLLLPASEKVLCIVNENKIIPATAYIFDKIETLKNEGKIINQIEEYFKQDDLVYGDVHKDILVHYGEIYKIYSVQDLLNVSINNMFVNNIVVNKCKNCNSYFIPTNKNNETLCDNIYKNGKTCKQLSYEIKLESDEITKLYRNAYKTQNAKKQRNKYIPDIDNRFKEWVNNAKEQKRKCEEKIISISEFRKWLKNNENWNIKKGGENNGNRGTNKK